MKIAIEKLDMYDWKEYGEFYLFPSVKYVKPTREDRGAGAVRLNFWLWSVGLVVEND